MFKWNRYLKEIHIQTTTMTFAGLWCDKEYKQANVYYHEIPIIHGVRQEIQNRKCI